MFAGVAGSLEGLELKLKSEAVRNLALSLLIIAGAMFLLASIPEEDFIRAAATIGIIGGAMYLMANSVKKFVPTMKRLSLNSAMNALSMNLAAKAMIDFGKAMLLFVASVWILSTIPADKLQTGLVGMIGIAGVMVILARLLSKNTGAFFVASIAVQFMATALLILALSFKLMATVDDAGMERSLKAMFGITAMMVAFSAASKFVKKANRTALAMIFFATALAIAAIPLKILGSMSWEELGIALAAIAGIATVVMTMAMLSKFVSKAITAALGIFALGVGLSAFAGSLALLGTLSWDGILQSLAAIGILVALVAGVTAVGGSSIAILLGLGVSLVVFSIGLSAFAVALKQLGGIEWKQLGMALAALTLMTVLMVVITNQFGLAGIFALGLLGVSLGVLSIGLYAFALALQKLGSVKWGALGKALLILLVFIPIVAVLGVVLGVISPLLMLFGIAIGMAGVGLLIFGTAIGLIGSMKFGTIVKGILALGVVLLALGATAFVLAPLIPALFGISLALLLFGAAILFLGVGISLIVGALATFGGIAFRAITQFADAIILAGPKIFEAFGAILIGILEVLGKLIPGALDLMIEVFEKLIPVIEEYGPTLIPIFVSIIDSLLVALADNAPSIADSLVTIFASILDSIGEQMGTLVDGLVNIVIGFVDKLGEKIPELMVSITDFMTDIINAAVKAIVDLTVLVVDAIADLIVDVILGLGQAIEDNAQDIKDAMDVFMDHMYQAMLTFWGIESPSSVMIDIAGYLIAGLVKGVADGVTDIIAAGKSMVTNFKKGITDNWSKITTYLSGKITDMTNLFSGIKDEFISIGGDIVDGLKQGLEDTWDSVTDVLNALVEFLPKWARKLLGIASPSKVFAEIGGYIGEGMAEGIGGNASMVKDETAGLAQEAIDGVEGSGLSELMSKIYNVLTGEFDEGLVIRPVMDLSNVYEGRDQIYSMMRDLNGIGVGGSNEMASKASSGVRSSKISTATTTQKSSNNQIQNGQSEPSIVNNTFNITGGNPKRIAEEVSKALQNQIDRRHAQWAR